MRCRTSTASTSAARRSGSTSASSARRSPPSSKDKGRDRPQRSASIQEEPLVMTGLLTSELLAGDRVDETSVRQYQEEKILAVWRVIWRRKLLILGIVALSLLSAALVVSKMSTVYSSAAMVLLDPRETKYVNFDSVVSGRVADAVAVRSETHVIRSPAIAARVVRKLGLGADPEF